MTKAELVGVAPGPWAGVHRFAHPAMATVFEVLCTHDDATYAGQAAQAAFDLVDQIEREQSRFVGNSDVSRINLLSAGLDTQVSPTTMECLEIARQMYDVTGGAFDVSIGTGLDQLELVPDGFLVRARGDGVRLDLGGIGKGYAVDRMAELLEEWGIRRALVHGGKSSVVAMEAPEETEGWPLTLSAPDPGEPRVLARIAARQMALSASGTQKAGHIVDPRTGQPVQDRAAWVALRGREEGAATSPAAVAEALSTAFVILPPDVVDAWRRDSPGALVWLYP